MARQAAVRDPVEMAWGLRQVFAETLLGDKGGTAASGEIKHCICANSSKLAGKTNAGAIFPPQATIRLRPEKDKAGPVLAVRALGVGRLRWQSTAGTGYALGAEQTDDADAQYAVVSPVWTKHSFIPQGIDLSLNFTPF